MELSDIVLAFVSILSAITGGVVKNIMTDIKDLEKNMNQCQQSMPKEYMLKADYHSDAKDIKDELREQSKKIDQIWKHMRISK